MMSMIDVREEISSGVKETTMNEETTGGEIQGPGNMIDRIDPAGVVVEIEEIHIENMTHTDETGHTVHPDET